MIPSVHSLKEAKEFFLYHALGWCMGYKENDEELELHTYREAVQFYGEK